ncbi:hypothetical protein TKK_0015847 [Trichogramma kaykai]|uniref:Mediator of RNA polymerase II transcription subunit 4 n=1 Tax=Trichogramma kaykai TaxID=54128 RepID=A0ABD2W8K7_9HYME
MSIHKSTREMLLSVVDDMEIISKELIENITAAKHLKLSTSDHSILIELLINKDKELKSFLTKAEEQAKINQKMETLKAEVHAQDQEIQQLQKQLKEAEQILATSIFQARQKLQSIAKANKRPVPSEELIKYAHRISASNAVCAPLSWQQGDPRRPYPTDIEMRVGCLGRLSDLPLNGQMVGPHSNITDLHRPSGQQTETIPPQVGGPFAWHPSGEIHMSVTGQGTVPINTHKQETEDVEVMSTDSSSSSSSDSQ